MIYLILVYTDDDAEWPETVGPFARPELADEVALNLDAAGLRTEVVSPNDPDHFTVPGVYEVA